MNQLNERVNIEIAKKFKGMTYSQFYKVYDSLYPIASVVDDDESSDDDLNSQYKKINKYCNKIFESGNNFSVTYDYAFGKNFGRLFEQNGGIQKIFNGFRGVLFDGITYDVDMNNCHPNILVNICRKHNIDCFEVQRYINNRDEYLNELMSHHNISRADAKKAILSVLNKEMPTLTINKKKVNSAKFKKLDAETSAIISKLFDIYKQDYFKYVKNDDYNQKGKMVNLILTKIENEYLQRAVKYFNEQGVEICCLMFDGLMIYKNDTYDIEDCIEALNELFSAECMKWSVKEHNTELLEILENLTVSDTDTYLANDMIDLGNHILNGLLKDKLVKCMKGDTLELFLITNYSIISKEASIKHELYRIISGQDYYIDNGKKKECVSKNHTFIKQVAESLISCCPVNNLFIEDVWNYTQFKLFFKNGYYDFETSKFNYGEFNMTFFKIDFDYNENSDPEVEQEILEKIFFPMFGIDFEDHDTPEGLLRRKLLRRLLYTVARMVAGNVEDKSWLIIQGLRNCGKGVLYDILENSFGDYITTTNSGNFLSKRAEGDEEKSLGFLVDFQFCRMVFTNEVSIQKGTTMDGNIIKKFVSGGDKIKARKLFVDGGKKKLQCGLVMCLNDMPAMSHSDALETCDRFNLTSTFIDENFDEAEKLSGYKYYKTDKTIKTKFLKRQDVRDAFISLIFKYYNKPIAYPEEILKENKEVEDDSDNTKLFSLFEFTGNSKDVIFNKKLESIIKKNNISLSMIMCKKLLKTKKCKAVDLSKGRGWSGLKEKIDYDDDDECKIQDEETL